MEEVVGSTPIRSTRSARGQQSLLASCLFGWY